MSVPMRWDPCVATQPMIDQPAPQLRSRLRARRVPRIMIALYAGIVGALAALGIAALYSAPRPVAAPALRSANEKAVYGLVNLQSSHAERNLGFVTVAGSAVNRSGGSLSDVEAVVELLDNHGHTLRVESALTALSVIRRGQTTPFQVELQDAHQASAYRIRFKRLLGGTLD